MFTGGKKNEQLSALLQAGAVVIDVRSPQEFSTGHVAGALNVPLGSIGQQLSQIKKLGKPVVACCASGMRSASAAAQLKREGIEAINGGSWTKVQSLCS